jgi:UDP-N-acetylmuramoyl-L-alanyl-D-glutamate--2,6-diaminopimelate ligase
MNVKEMKLAEIAVESMTNWDLESLISAVPTASVKGEGSARVEGIAYDSRQVERGDLFFCIRGLTSDGHGFVPQALKAGAAAIVAEEPVDTGSRPLVIVKDTREALARTAAALYGYPSRSMKVLGITGTNGKTTTSYMTAAVFEKWGLKAGVLGTLGYASPGFKQTGAHTTPEAPIFQGLLRSMADDGVSCVAAEISSHALHLKRAAATFFEAALFTNLSRDHLDFHGTLDAYRRAKLDLFHSEGTLEPGSPRWAILNADDSNSKYFAEATEGAIVTYGTAEGAVVQGANVTLDPEGSTFQLTYEGMSFPVRVSLPGSFNVHNALAAAAAGFVFGCDAGAIAAGIESVRVVPGRMERIECGQDFRVIVDYAHTPDALSNVLAALRSITPGKLICVFGCGGDRDQGKRPLMGSAVTGGCDFAVVTSDNPRSEDPLKIIAQIVKGIEAKGRDNFKTVPDRAKAIETGLRMAKTGDTVLIAGKGHEDYQILGDRRIHFDDREIAKNVLDNMGHGRGPSEH